MTRFSVRRLRALLLCLPALLYSSAMQSQTSTVMPIAQCMEYLPSQGPEAYVLHFGYYNSASQPVSFVTAGPYNNLQPSTAAKTIDTFYPGFHPDALVIKVQGVSAETWNLGNSHATFNLPDLSSYSGTGTTNNAPVCSPRLIPATLQFNQPGTYRQQYLGQLDGGPGPENGSNVAATVSPLGQTDVSISNLTYVPSDPANPSGALNPNSIYGDVTLSATTPNANYLKLQVLVHGTVASMAFLQVTTLATVDPELSLSVPDHQYGDAPFALAAASESTGALTYRVVSGPATVAENIVSLTGAGKVVLSASQAWKGDYTAASTTTSFIVKKASAMVTLSALNQNFTGSPVDVMSSTVPSGLGVAYTYAGMTQTPVQPGSYPVTAVITDPNYAGMASGVLVINGPITGTVQLISKTTLSRAADGSLLVTIALVNNGTGTAQNVALTSLSIGAAAAPMPLSFGYIAPQGGSASRTFALPSPAGASGSVVPERLTVTYAGGTFAATVRALLP